MGNLPPSSNITDYTVSPVGVISSISYTNANSVARITINHSDPGWNYRVFCNMYSDTISTNDNDANAENVWTHQPSRTQTVLLYEYNSSESNL